MTWVPISDLLKEKQKVRDATKAAFWFCCCATVALGLATCAQYRSIHAIDAKNKAEKNLETLRLQLQAMTTYEVSLSAYNAVKGQTDSTPHWTATNRRAVPGLTCAVSRDLSHLLGKEIYIPGYGPRHVTDVMNERWTRKIDLLVATVAEARKIGNIKTRITVL